VFKFSRPVQENSGGVLTVKLDYILKGALVEIILVLIMKNIIDTKHALITVANNNLLCI
jgi:hypothetical protein